jgi:ribonuclease Z
MRIRIRLAPAVMPSTSSMSRRLPLLWLTSYLLIGNLLLVEQALSQESDESDISTPIVVTLLGTSAPTLDPELAGMSTLITIGKTKFLVDAGRGVVQQLSKLNPDNNAKAIAGIDRVLITHLHYDHTISLDDFWLSRWQNSRKRVPLKVWGPEGTQASVGHMIGAYEVDVADRFTRSESLGIRGEGNPRIKILTTEITQDGVIYAEDGIKITAFAVDHGMPALGYRIDYANKAVVISGDTTYSPNLIKNAQNVDLIIHELFSFSPEYKDNPVRPIILKAHTTAEQAGEVFNLTKPKLAVYSHIGNFPKYDASMDYIALTKKNYLGRVIVGKDLMTITISDDVTVSTELVK